MLTKRSAGHLVLLLLLVAAAVTAGCATNVPFRFFRDAHRSKAASIAVVAGSTDEADARFADHVTKSLQEKSTLKVLSQAEVDRRVGKYPVKIKTAEPRDANKPVWLAPGEKAKIDAMHGALRTDYVLVVWITDLSRYSSQNSVSYGASIIGNLFEYSPGNAVGYSDYGRSRSQSCFLFGGSEGKDIDALLRGSAADLAAELADQTKTTKK